MKALLVLTVLMSFARSTSLHLSIKSENGEDLKNILSWVQYSAYDKADSTIARSVFSLADDKGYDRIKMRNCRTNEPLKIVVWADGYLPEFFSLKNAENLPKNLELQLTQKTNRTRTKEMKFVIHGRGKYDSDHNSVEDKIHNTHFIDLNGLAKEEVQDSSVLSVRIDQEGSNAHFLIKSLKGRLIPVNSDNKNDMWWYDSYNEERIADSLQFDVSYSSENEAKAGYAFILQLDEHTAHRYYIEFEDDNLYKQWYGLDVFVTPEKKDDTLYYYLPTPRIFHRTGDGFAEAKYEEIEH